MSYSLVLEQTFNTSLACGFCSCHHDDGRTSKDLSWAHTVCLQCSASAVQEQDNFITTELKTGSFCHENVPNLPNSPLILEIVMHSKEKSQIAVMPESKSPSELLLELSPATEMLEQTIEIEPADESPQMCVKWCLDCLCEWTDDCISEYCGYCHFHLKTVNSLKNMEAMVILKEKLDLIQVEGSRKLSEATQKRKEAQMYLSKVSMALNQCSKDIWKLEVENDNLIAEMTAALKSEQMKESVKEEEHKVWISEMASLMKEQPDCQVYTQPLEELGNKLVSHFYQQKLTDATLTLNSIEMQNKFSVPSSVLDQATKTLPCWNIGANGQFSVNWRNANLESSPPVVPNLLMLTHVAFLIKNRPQQGRQQQQPKASASSESAGVHSAGSSSDNSSPSLPFPAPVIALKRPIPALMQLDCRNPPSPPPTNHFIARKRSIPSLMKLDCRTPNPPAAKKPKRSTSTTVSPIDQQFFVGKSWFIMALYNISHTREGATAQRSYNLPSEIKKEYEAREFGDVDVTLLKDHQLDDRIIGWSLTFPLQDYKKWQKSTGEKHTSLPRAFLLGRVQNKAGKEIISKLAASNDFQSFYFRLRSD